MDLKKHIISKYGSQYRFAKAHNLSTSLVNYWCKKPWDEMSYKLKQRIKEYTN